MTILTALALSAALQQQAPLPARQQPRPNAARPSATVIQPSAPSQPQTPFDSTVGAISDIGTKVAEVRSNYELYRRAAFNDPNGALVERATLYRASCRALAAATTQGEHRICRACLPRTAQPAIDRYRANLPALHAIADQCATRIDRLRARGNENAVAAAMRADARAEADRLVVGFRPYEARVVDVRRVMGWDQRPIVPTPRRGS